MRANCSASVSNALAWPGSVRAAPVLTTVRARVRSSSAVMLRASCSASADSRSTWAESTAVAIVSVSVGAGFPASRAAVMVLSSSVTAGDRTGNGYPDLGLTVGSPIDKGVFLRLSGRAHRHEGRAAARPGDAALQRTVSC